MNNKNEVSILVVGLGYVGLPLAVELSFHFKVGGYDIDKTKIDKLKQGIDETETYTKKQLNNLTNINFSNNPKCIKKFDIIIVAVPTPINKDKTPDFSYVEKVCETIGEFAKPNALIIFESTFYPGATEEICIPIIEKSKGKIWKKDFNVGYSPERVNPGDSHHSVKTIAKIISADSIISLKKIRDIYEKIIDAEIVEVTSIKTAEACKVLENTQRDVNIALINEFAMFLDKLDIDTLEVINASKTKWNFIPFTPGLVGGHCIGIDPYYLIHKASEVNQKMSLVKSARSVNEGMVYFIKDKIKDFIQNSGKHVTKTSINILGLTFKEDCNDIRNSKAQTLIEELQKIGANLTLHDPLADKKTISKNWGYQSIEWQKLQASDFLIICQAHTFYKELDSSVILSKSKSGGVVIELKELLNPEFVSKNNRLHWRL
jgi:UDP-N-acetyl-D-galactosamine dehydrogenase